MTESRTYNIAEIFCDHMVLQRGMPIKLWGTCNKPQTISVSINGERIGEIRCEDGRWEITLPPLREGFLGELEVSGENPAEEIVIHDVAVGEVWIAGGQSNMEFSLKFDVESDKSIGSADNDQIRFYDVPKIKFEGQELEDDFSQYGIWRICNKENAPFYSAVGFYFAQGLNQELKVPIGIIGCNSGGTSASAWMAENYLKEDTDLSIYFDEYNRAIQNLDIEKYDQKERYFRKKMASPKLKKYVENFYKKPSILMQLFAQTIGKMMLQNTLMNGPKSGYRPSGLYNTMLKRIMGYTAKGVIWYQGEADVLKAHIYDRLFSELIRCWRDGWGYNLPFFFVQLAPLGKWLMEDGKHYPELRAQQELVSKTVPGTYMVSIMDVGDKDDIHPKQKRPVGERLALLALGKAYNKDLLCEAPEVLETTRTGDSISVWFANTGEGLQLLGSTLLGLEVNLDGKTIKDIGVSVHANTLTIQSPLLSSNSKIQIRYAWVPYTKVNLCNSAGLPAKPFIVNI